ncbi:efflux RND transporter periplasmic adaptor subunit [Victivallis vadensis]|uniref:RND family efflux transporter MFP subunit n=1 Tax=Victivallis vadensis TaxID=172901 RepID=A0A2U1B069_9BACT|nr:efflux RND transporter periplasmic adaptor subunit [Victivallis vadensis]PVY42084.1 RND family efflux transporter MFP subunit [Victivallis vadensis]
MRWCAFFLLLFAAPAYGEAVKAVLFPFREAVIAARAESTLLPYRFKLGEPFKAGEVLTALDDSRYALEVRRATEQADFARAVFEDRKQLRAKNFTSDHELKKAEFDLSVAESSLADAKLNLSYCIVKAPFAGKLAEIRTQEYETVRPGQPLFRIIDDNRLLAVMNVPLNDAALTTVGNPVVVSVSGTDRKAKGTVYEVAPQADHRTGTVRIRVLIDNGDGKLRAGMTGELIHDE